ncbi:hypothetical protein B0H19DRAFT_1263886 [Mycena capillaripes]|nr:hypothetical protein B0H19DRAFT_1263886 [Mycena capillaripes]
MPPPTTSSPVDWVTLIPDPIARAIAIIILIAMVWTSRLAFPSRRITSMNRGFEDMSKLYHKAVDDHLLNFQLESDFAIWMEFLALDDMASELRIKTLARGNQPCLWWWNEFVAVFNGHSLAIVKCTWCSGILKRKIQLICETRAHDLNVASSGVGLTPGQQFLLRRRRTPNSDA